MDKAKKRRNRRRNRDMRWVESWGHKYLEDAPPIGGHRQKKILGVEPEKHIDRKGKEVVSGAAFWRRGIDDVPRFSRLYYGERAPDEGSEA